MLGKYNLNFQWCNTPLFDSMGRVQQPEDRNQSPKQEKEVNKQGFWTGIGSNIKYIFFDSWVSANFKEKLLVDSFQVPFFDLKEN